MGPIADAVQQEVRTAIDAWEEIFPVVFLITSLVLQIVLLITGEFRKHTSKVRLFAWLAYVGADVTASFLLGLLSRKTHRSQLFGLWSALLVYHLGGPDNFTAYERADSELWLRHLLSLVLQVVTAAYVIAVNTRGFLILPTLLVFVVGVLRYWERNYALKWSSRGRLNEAMAPIYEYMEHMPRDTGSSSNLDDVDQLRLIVAGAGDLVTTSDIFQVVGTNFSDSDYYRVRACQLSVAFASSFAYLRRILSLSRLEHRDESSQSMMRRLWFRNEQFLTRKDWLAYILIERDFLYNWLYAKPIFPDTYISRLMLRVVSSMALFTALVLVIVNPSIWSTQAHERLKKDSTFVVLAAGFLVEIAYLLRLVASKRAVVAMLVAVVRTQRRRSKFVVRELWTSLLLNYCRLSLVLNGFFENQICSFSKGTSFLPRSNLICRYSTTWPSWIKHAFCIPQTGWDHMYLTVALNESELLEIQAQETPALDRVLELVEYYAEYRVWHDYFSHGGKKKPIYMLENLDIFVVYYDGNWETILLLWWIGTLKVLILEGRSNNSSEAEQTTETSEPDHDGLEENFKIEIRSNSSEEEEISADEGKSIKELRNRALWLMAYVCRLLTVCPELLPTHLELTKKMVAKELEHVHNQMANTTNWMEETRSKVARLEIPALTVGNRRSKEAVDATLGSMTKEGFAGVDSKDVDGCSTKLAVLLVDCMSVEDRWGLIEGTAAHFVACLADAGNKNVENCAKLTEGGELLTFLWILFSHLGGGST